MAGELRAGIEYLQGPQEDGNQIENHINSNHRDEEEREGMSRRRGRPPP